MRAKMIRSSRIWIKITKPSAKRFEFHRGYQGDTKAFHSQIWPTSVLPTWEDAIKLAESQAQDH